MQKLSKNQISQFILNKYNWTDVVQKTEKLYEAVRK